MSQTPVISQQSAANQVSRFRWWIHLLLIGGYFVPGLLVRHPARHPALTHSSSGLLIVCAIDVAVFAIVFCLALLASRASKDQLYLRWRPSWWVVPLGVLYSIAIRAAIAVLVIAVSLLLLATVFDEHQLRTFWQSRQPDPTIIVSAKALRSDPLYAWLLVTVVSFVVAGVREELWRAGTLAGMRALWPRGFNTRSGEFMAVVLVAIVFGAAHLAMGLQAAIMAAILGIFLGSIMVVHRSIWPAVIAHGCFDALSFALIAWVPAGIQQFRG